MADLHRDKMGIAKIDDGMEELTASCGAVDLRDCSMMKHILLAEIRRSNAPAWVAEEVDKKLRCHCCRRMASGTDRSS
jgi:hypothetical protein